MPQANKYLSDRWNESSAFIHLNGKIIEHAGWIVFKKEYTPTDQDYEAIDYLCQEWDYGFGG